LPKLLYRLWFDSLTPRNTRPIKDFRVANFPAIRAKCSQLNFVI
jgi:hypothetical protein